MLKKRIKETFLLRTQNICDYTREYFEKSKFE